ncbi:MAG TPA: HAD family hydrolase [Fibrobacteraceae bacterium]|nr:HAD family hydrolase [Fibrobacteraceae bacterium]
MGPRGILFDLYGTLFVYGDMVHAWSDWLEDLQEALGACGVRTSREALGIECDGFFSGTVSPLSSLTVYETRLYLLAERLGGTPRVEWSQRTATSTLTRWQAQISVDPASLPVLKELRNQGIRTGVLTNFDHPPHVRGILDFSELSPWLDAVIISGECGLKKPDPAIFRLALSSLGTSPKWTWFVGDHPQQDSAGAHLSGLHAILLQREPSGLDRLHTNYRSNLTRGSEEDVPQENTMVATSMEEALTLFLNDSD